MESVEVYAFDGSVTKKLSVPSTDGYLTAVTWMSENQVLLTWLTADHQMEQYVICDITAATCQLVRYDSMTGIH